MRATWGLVVATALLVLATLIPFVGDLLRRRKERQGVASRTVPDLNILRSRLGESIRRLGHPEDLDQAGIEDVAEWCGEDLEILAPIVKVRDASLQFTNELYIARHLLTFTLTALDRAASLAGTTGADPRKRDEALREARRSYQAALLTLDAAEELLPKSQRLIKGERFWDRFARVSDERENDAARILVQKESVSRTQKRDY